MKLKNKTFYRAAVLSCVVLLLTFLSSCDKDYLPEKFEYDVDVANFEVKDITAYSAQLYFSNLQWGYSYGVAYSSVPGVTKENGTVISQYGNYYDYLIDNLTPAITYYYRGFIEDKYGAVVYGEEKSFTTNKYIPSEVTTGSATNDGYKYNSYEGSYFYYFTIYASITGVEEVSVFGIEVSSYNITSSTPTGNIGTFSLSSIKNGETYSQTWMTTSSGTQYYRAYAKLKTGEYIFGEVKSVYVY